MTEKEKARLERRERSGERWLQRRARQILDQTEGEGGGGGLCCRLSTIRTSRDSLKASASRVESERDTKQKERGSERAAEKQKVTECESCKQIKWSNK